MEAARLGVLRNAIASNEIRPRWRVGQRLEFTTTSKLSASRARRTSTTVRDATLTPGTAGTVSSWVSV